MIDFGDTCSPDKLRKEQTDPKTDPNRVEYCLGKWLDDCGTEELREMIDMLARNERGQREENLKRERELIDLMGPGEPWWSRWFGN